MDLLNKLIVTALPLVPKPIVARVSRRYIAGARLSDAVQVVRDLNARGIMATVDVLGEYVKDEKEAWEAAEIYKKVLTAIAENRLDANISIKLTQMGLKLGGGVCREVVASIMMAARERGTFVRVDMEDSTCTDETIDLFLSIRKEFDNAGIVVQSCLRRTLGDVARLAPLGTNFRLCKGIYIEPRVISYRDPEIIRSNYVLLLEEMLRQGCYVGIATHDERLVWSALAAIHRLQVPRERFEFQMLLGVDAELRRIIVESGYRMRVYVPFGEKWHAYSVRRLKENPKIVGYAMKAFFDRDS
jgi:proline dehydrogenase